MYEKSFLILAAFTSLAPAADPPADIRELKLKDWEPRSMMVTKTTIVEKPMFPVIDVHNHLGGGKQTLTPERVQRYLTELSEALLLVSRVEEARSLAGRLLELSRTHIGRGYQAHACRLLGETAACGDPLDAEQAEIYYRQALALADELGMRPLLAHCHLGLGTLYARTGQRAHARAERRFDRTAGDERLLRARLRLRRRCRRGCCDQGAGRRQLQRLLRAQWLLVTQR